MEPDLTCPYCSRCMRPAQLVERTTRFRSADRLQAFDAWIWECPAGCPDPKGGVAPIVFPPLPSYEPLRPFLHAHNPLAQRPKRVPVLLTVAEAEYLDRIRGSRTRSEFLRMALEEAANRAG